MIFYITQFKRVKGFRKYVADTHAIIIEKVELT